MEKLAKKLVYYRKLNGLKQKDVAQHLHLANQTYAAYEQNVSEPDCATLVDIADFYGISLNQLLGDEKDYLIISKEQYQSLIDARDEHDRANAKISRIIRGISGTDNSVRINGDNNVVNINSGNKGGKEDE